MFDELPGTNPARHAQRSRSIVAGALIQAILVFGIIRLQLAVGERIGGIQFFTPLYMTTPGPLNIPLGEEKPIRQPSKPQASVHPSHRESTALQSEAPHQGPVEEHPTTIEGDVANTPAGFPNGVSNGLPGGTGSPVRMDPNSFEARILKMVKPEYPMEARHAHLQGVVTLEATVTEAGDVVDVKPVSGPTLLFPAAIKAIREWKYAPVILNGRAMPVVLTVKVNFSLNG